MLSHVVQQHLLDADHHTHDFTAFDDVAGFADVSSTALGTPAAPAGTGAASASTASSSSDTHHSLKERALDYFNELSGDVNAWKMKLKQSLHPHAAGAGGDGTEEGGAVAGAD